MFESTRSESSTRRRPRQILLREDIRRLVVFAVTILIIVPVCALVFGGFDRWQNVSWRIGLNPAAFSAASVATRIHTIFILTMVVTGWGMLALPKGDLRHRVLGWSWVSAMTLMGITSMAVPHGSSWISAYVGGGSALALMSWGLLKAKRRRYRDHARTMVMLMIALIVMTLLAMMPGRLMHDVLFGG